MGINESPEQADVEDAINRWVDAIDLQIESIDKRIEGLGESKNKPIQMVSDLNQLALYLDNDNIPSAVRRAIGYCLAWNPYAKEGGSDDGT